MGIGKSIKHHFHKAKHNVSNIGHKASHCVKSIGHNAKNIVKNVARTGLGTALAFGRVALTRFNPLMMQNYCRNMSVFSGSRPFLNNPGLNIQSALLRRGLNTYPQTMLFNKFDIHRGYLSW